MRATDFEFRNRFWVIGSIFGLGFFCYNLDHVNVGVALLNALEGPGWDTDQIGARHQLQIVFAVAALLVAISAMIRTWATAYLDSEVVHDARLRTEGLTADGPYRYVRNPLYLANILMTLGMGMMASRLGWLLLVVVHFVFLLRLIGREEQALSISQGERYREFCRSVPRLWPSFRPRVPSGGKKPQWRQAWLSEAFFFWGFAVASATFAATLKLQYAGIIFGVCMLILIFVLPAWKKRRTSHPA